MLDTKLEENNGEKNNLRRTIDAIDGENNKVSYLANQKDNEEKLEFLKNFTEKESRDKIISSLEHKVSPDLFKIVYLAQRMIKEFIKDERFKRFELLMDSKFKKENLIMLFRNIEKDNRSCFFVQSSFVCLCRKSSTFSYRYHLER